MKSETGGHFSAALLLPVTIDDVSYGNRFFKILQDIYPDLMPRKYGDTEPLKHVFDGDIEKMLSISWRPRSASPYCEHQFIWKPQLRGTLAFWSFSSMFGDQKLHSSLAISGKPSKFRLTNIESLHRGLMRHSPVDIGHIHILAHPELDHYKRYYDEMVSCLNIGFVTVKLKRYIGNLAWGTFFGRPYVEMMRVERLLSAPASVVERWGDGVYIQVTENIEDTVDNFEEFDRLRMEIKEHLGRHYFFSPDLPKSEYRAPTFDFTW